MQCDMCNPPPSYGDWKIIEYKNWIIYIHPNQSYLGRCFIVLKRHIEDFFDMREEEFIEYFQITKKLRDVLIRIFRPDRFNYAILGMNRPHVHLNFVPRYKEKREFGGVTFKDERWGSNYSPYDKDFKIPDNVLFAIRDKIKENL